MFKKILVANRGEIALRVVRAARELGVQTVAIHSTADAHALHVKFADESICIGPPQPDKSYLNIPAIIAAAEVAGVDAIHPGYGFLSENAHFAQVCQTCGFKFIGPQPEMIKLMGNKIAARETMRKVGLPVIPGSGGAVESEEEALRVAREIGLPIMIKAAAGGGGRGMKIVRDEAELVKSLRLARTEAEAAFGDGSMYLERYIGRPRHIEFQIAADAHGNVVHLGERECSVQRRHQKLIEESPSPAMTEKKREEVGALIVSAIEKLGYESVGTIELLMDEGRNLYFMEMNTRIQVEHPVTEEVTGIDLVRLQIRIAAGERLPFEQRDISFRGHAIELRINAEDPYTFAPSPGTLTDYNTPGGPGIRIDTAVTHGAFVNPHYDSLIAKLVVHDVTRDKAIKRAKSALREFIVAGISTNIDFHRLALDFPDFVSGDYDTNVVPRILATARP